VDDPAGTTPAKPHEPQPPARVPRRYAGPAAEKPPARRKASTSDAGGLRSWNWLLGLIGAAVAIAALLIVPGILNKGGKNPVAEAAEATRDAPGFRMTLEMSMQGSMPVSVSGGGVMNGETQRASMQFRINAGNAGSFTMNEVIDELDLYMSSPELTQRLGTTKQWLLIKADALLGDLMSSSSGGLGAGMSASPSQQLDALEKASDQVTLIGHEQIDGVETSHYSAVVDVRKALGDLGDGKLADLVKHSLDQMSPFQTVEVWIDGQGLLRRERSNTTMGAMGTSTMTMDFTDYGIHPQIDVPPASDVYDLTPMLDQILGS
jgi:hypothetical protein